MAYRVGDAATSRLDPAVFHGLAIGTDRDTVAAGLPGRTRTEGTGIPVPPGTSCEHFSVSADPFAADLYRLCWRDGELATKDVIERSMIGT